jgi:hypothetical protein
MSTVPDDTPVLGISKAKLKRNGKNSFEVCGSNLDNLPKSAVVSLLSNLVDWDLSQATIEIKKERIKVTDAEASAKTKSGTPTGDLTITVNSGPGTDPILTMTVSPVYYE